MPWGIQYGVHSPAFQNHLLSHQIGMHDTLSLSVHPVPLYFIITCLLIGVALIILRHYWKRPGNLTLFGLMLLLASRFLIEFFRDPQSNGSFQGNYFLGIKIVQLFCLAAAILLWVVIRYRENRFIPTTYSIQPNHPLHNASYLFMLSVLLYVTRSWFSNIEFGVLLITLIPASLSVIIHLFTSYYSNRVRFSTVSLLILSLIVMAQKSPDSLIVSYKTVRFGFSGGDYTNKHTNSTGSGCNRVSNSQEFQQKYNLVGVGYSIIEKDSFKVLELGLNGYLGTRSETGLSTGVRNTDPIVGINPFIKIDNKWFGGGFGFHYGKLKLTPFDWYEERSQAMPQTGTINTNIYPMGYARFGPEKILSLSFHLGDQFPAPFPALYQYFELGSGFGSNKGFKLSVGVNLLGSFLMQTRIPIADKFMIVPLYQSRNGFDSQFNDSQFSIGLQYMFGKAVK